MSFRLASEQVLKNYLFSSRLFTRFMLLIKSLKCSLRGQKKLDHSQIGLLFRGCSVFSLSWPQDPTQRINPSCLVSSVQMEGGERLELANLHLFVELDLSYVCSNMFFLLGPFLFVVKKAIKNSEPRY